MFILDSKSGRLLNTVFRYFQTLHERLFGRQNTTLDAEMIIS